MSQPACLYLILAVAAVFGSTEVGAQVAASETRARGKASEALAYHLPVTLHAGETWTDLDVAAIQSAPNVASVRSADRRGRTVRGAVIGGIGGAFLGMGSGAMYSFVYGGDGAVIGLAGGAVFGAGAGALLGHSSGRGNSPRR